jgi:YD repeat-containing protein
MLRIEAKSDRLCGLNISTRSRDERCTLNQTRNWTTTTLDLNGDNDWLDAGEFQEDRTHNVVNELTNRDQDTNATAGYENAYDLTYDTAGNLTNDGKDYTYVWDAFGRLRYVKTRGGSPTVVGEYR